MSSDSVRPSPSPVITTRSLGPDGPGPESERRAGISSSGLRHGLAPPLRVRVGPYAAEEDIASGEPMGTVMRASGSGLDWVDSADRSSAGAQGDDGSFGRRYGEERRLRLPRRGEDAMCACQRCRWSSLTRREGDAVDGSTAFSAQELGGERRMTFYAAP
eukprot:4593215-Prymnesium_polylepis.1